MPGPNQSQPLPRHWVRAVANVVNLSTPLGLLVALIGGSRLRRGPNLIWYAERYRLGFPIAGAFTMGNVVLIPRRTAAELEASRPGVMAHEDVHAWQWAYCLGLPFLPIYVAAQGWSWLRTGHIGSANFFEVQAGLATGGYPDLPKRPLRAGFASFRRIARR